MQMNRGRTVTTLVFVALLSLLAADISVGCGAQAYVYGPVSQKYSPVPSEPNAQILISGQAYEVPMSFYNQVQVGDVVRFNGRAWSIVQRHGVPVTPTSLP
jgi:hypothetical protein